jgi:hypothetical protein
MELSTLDDNFEPENIIDGYESLIWTEKYYGDSEVEVVVPATKQYLEQLPTEKFLGLDEAEDIMIIETRDVKAGKMKITGISLLSWLNNRFLRTSEHADDKAWDLTGPNFDVGEILYTVIHAAIGEDSPYLTGLIPIGIDSPDRFMLPQIRMEVGDWPDGLYETDTWIIPYGPLYDTLRSIASGYEVGIQIVRLRDPFSPKPLRFRIYRGEYRIPVVGEDRVVVRFSEDLDSLTEAEELESIAKRKDLAIAFATNYVTMIEGGEASAFTYQDGFKLRVMQVLIDDFGDPNSTGTYPSDEVVKTMLETRAKTELGENTAIKVVTGTLVDTFQHRYGSDYYLGDVVQLKGSNGAITNVRVTEYIRSQDSQGTRRYPTLEQINPNLV